MTSLERGAADLSGCAHAADPWSLTGKIGSKSVGRSHFSSDRATCPAIKILAIEPLVQGSRAAWGRIVSQKSDFFFEQATCPGQLRCQGQNFSSKYDSCLNKPLVPGSFVVWGRTFYRKTLVLERATCPGQLRCLGQSCFQKRDFFVEETTCLGKLRCLGQNCFTECSFFWE